MIRWLKSLFAPQEQWTVRVFKYSRVGTREVVWQMEYCQKDTARTAGQAVMFYLDGTQEHSVSFEVYKSTELPIEPN